MTIGQSNRERMGDKVNINLNQNSAVYQGSPKFQGYATQHSDNLTDVRKWKNLQEEGLEIIGINRDKNALRSLMIADSQPIIGAIWTVSSVTGNDALKASVDYTESFMKGCTESKFIAACTQIKTVASANSAALLDEGITAQMITNLGSDTASFQNMMTKGSTKKSDVATYTLNLKKAVSKMMSHLKNVLDNSIKQWKKTVPDFVTSYFLDRKIIKYGNPHSGVRGHVEDSETHQKLNNLIVEIVELKLLTSSHSKGYFEFSNVPEGTYTLLFRGVNYIPTEIPVEVEKAKFTTVTISIEHQPVPESVPA